MNHRISGRKLNRETSHRKALLRNLAISLIEHGTIKTTVPKAKELRGFIEPLITKSKLNDLSVRRYLIAKLRCKDAINKLLDDIGPRHMERPGGYTRVLKCGFRATDAAPMAYIQILD